MYSIDKNQRERAAIFRQGVGVSATMLPKGVFL